LFPEEIVEDLIEIGEQPYSYSSDQETEDRD
jgi:hypothetical protein